MRILSVLLLAMSALLGGVGLLQLIGGSARLDLTEQQLYSLSDGTREVLQSLAKPLTVELYFSEQSSRDLSQIRAYAERVNELLQEYRLNASSQLTVRRIDPEPFSVAEDDATRFGLQSVPVGSFGEQLYLGLVVRDEQGNYESLPFLQPDHEGYLEYELTQMIYRLQREKAPVIGMLSGLPVMGGFDPRTGQPTPAWTAIEQLRDLYEVRSLPEDITKVDDAIDVLLLIQPPELTEQALYAIDQYALSGGRILAFIDPVAEHAGAMMGMASTASATSLQRLLTAWGIDWQPNQAVVDAANALVVSQGPGKPPMRHIGLLSLGADSLDQEQLLSANLESVNIASAGSLTPLPEASSLFSPWLLSSADSMLVDVNKLQRNADLTALQRDFIASGERQVLAATVTGSANSAFNPQQADAVRADLEAGNEHLTSSDKLAVTVIADSDILSDRMWVQIQNFFGQRIATPWADNGTLLVNLADHLTGSSALMSLRARGQYQRPFERVDALRQQAEVRFLASEQQLQQRLAETEQKLAELQPASGVQGELTLSAEQQQALEEFQQQKLDIRRELRDVQHALNKDIETLGAWLKVLNILLLPLLLTGLLALLSLFWQRRQAV